jgi:hypothetical protein
MEKQSAIQWMSEALQALDETIKQAPKTVNYLATRENIVTKAEKMFAEQIMDANGAGFRDGVFYSDGQQWEFESPKDYYEHFYGKGDTK